MTSTSNRSARRSPIVVGALAAVGVTVGLALSGCVGYDQSWKNDNSLTNTTDSTLNWQWTDDYVRDQRLKQQQLSP